MASMYRCLSLALLCVPAAFAQMMVYSGGSVVAGATRGLVAYVPLSPNTVTWSVNGVTGGSAAFGKIAATGKLTATYTAPTAIPAANSVTVRATSTAFPTKYAEVTLTITQPVPQLWSISPSSVPAGAFTISLNGSNFTANSRVNFGSAQIATTLLSATSLRATGTASAAQAGTKVPISVTNTGPGTVTSQSVSLTVTAPVVTVSVTPKTAAVQVQTSQQFTATASNGSAITWSASAGTISSTGLYTAPATVPNPATATITASSGAAKATAIVTITPAPVATTLSLTPTTASVQVQTTKQFTATASDGSAITWSATAGTISSTGLYTAPATVPNPATATITASSGAATATANVTITAAPSTANVTAGRFLEQAAFGPTPASLARVQQIGIPAWLNEQVSMAETPIPMTSGNDVMEQQYLNRLSAAPDQLRQRLIHAFTQIIVISMQKNPYPDEMIPYLQILSRNALGNYRTMLAEITISPQMGKYLDLARSTKPSAGSGANENYARELMQLFSIGVNRLNLDGSVISDANGNPALNYTQPDVQQVALALTGWVYLNNAWEDFTAPMQPLEDNHDTRQKTFLNCTLPAGQTTSQDMNGVVDCVFNHPSMAPFLATRLIRALVTSNPSPAYVQRVASVFVDNGSGVRGDLSAVVKAILLDPEARNDAATANFGRLKDPIYQIAAFARALNGSILPANIISWELSLAAQTPLSPNSVFSFYSPLFHIPQTTLFGPEFQIYGPTEAVERGNLMWRMLSNPGGDFSLDLSAFNNVAADTTQLVNAIDQALFYGRMPSTLRQSLTRAIDAQSDNTQRVQTGIYLAAMSGLYAVQF